ncbi:MAG: TraR/DksA family transcriptional regulator [Comamonas sp.]
MTDEIDRAAARADELLADALAAHHRRSVRGKGQESANECRDCGDDIPEARRQAAPGTQRCVGCQGAFEGMRGAR